jgi:hypothetical protein
VTQITLVTRELATARAQTSITSWLESANARSRSSAAASAIRTAEKHRVAAASTWLSSETSPRATLKPTPLRCWAVPSSETNTLISLSDGWKPSRMTPPAAVSAPTTITGMTFKLAVESRIGV